LVLLQVFYDASYRDKKVVGVFIRAPLQSMNISRLRSRLWAPAGTVVRRSVDLDLSSHSCCRNLRSSMMTRVTCTFESVCRSNFGIRHSGGQALRAGCPRKTVSGQVPTPNRSDIWLKWRIFSCVTLRWQAA
jgi:hypothetical protein